LSGKGVLIWTHPGSQGWRPVGGFVLHGALMEIGVQHKFIYGSASDLSVINKIISYCEASYLKNYLNMVKIGAYGGRGMGQTCGVSDPSQWMRVFGVDIDSRDTAKLIRRAESITEERSSPWHLG
jgi:hypothetical protein